MPSSHDPLCVGILTPTGDEYRALGRFFPGRESVPAALGIQAVDLLVQIHPMRVLLACIGGQGIKRALERTDAVVGSIRADLWILSGIGGVRYDSDCQLWDLALASGGFDYSIVERHPERPRPSAEPVPISPDTNSLIAWLPTAQPELLGKVTALLDQHGIVRPSLPEASSEQVTATDPDLRRAILESVQSHRPRVASGQRQWLSVMFASGNDLHKDPDYLQRLTGHDKRLWGVEMEFAGFAGVCHRAGVPFLMVRAISDVVGYRKTKDETLFAAEVAGAGVRSLVESDGFRVWLSQLRASPTMRAPSDSESGNGAKERAKAYLARASLIVGLAGFLWFPGFLSSRAWATRMAIPAPPSAGSFAESGFVFAPVLLYWVALAAALGLAAVVLSLVRTVARRTPWKQTLARSTACMSLLVWVHAWPSAAKGVAAILLAGFAGSLFRLVWLFALDPSAPNFGCLPVWEHRLYTPVAAVIWAGTLLLGYSALHKKVSSGRAAHEYVGQTLCVTAVIVQLVALSLPWRLLHDERRERAIVGGVSGYVVSRDSERVYVYLPSRDETVTRARQDPDLALTGSQGYVFENFLCRP